VDRELFLHRGKKYVFHLETRKERTTVHIASVSYRRDPGVAYEYENILTFDLGTPYDLIRRIVKCLSFKEDWGPLLLASIRCLRYQHRKKGVLQRFPKDHALWIIDAARHDAKLRDDVRIMPDARSVTAAYLWDKRAIKRLHRRNTRDKAYFPRNFVAEYAPGVSLLISYCTHANLSKLPDAK
jgi:hypothetical protein